MGQNFELEDPSKRPERGQDYPKINTQTKNRSTCWVLCTLEDPDLFSVNSTGHHYNMIN